MSDSPCIVSLAPMLMSHFCACAHSLRRALCSGLALVFFVAVLGASVHAQQTDGVSLSGTIRDSQSKPVAAASVHLQGKDAIQQLSTQTDSQGRYHFAGLRVGVYAVRAEMAGYSGTTLSSIFLGPREAKTVDLTLGPAKHAAAQPAASTSPMQSPLFYDQPQFTVAGVTDTTSLGGHGSDTVARARESLAKETASLGKATNNAQSADAAAAAAEERSLRASVEQEPRSFEANRRLGRLLIDQGKARSAIPYLERAAELHGGDYETAYDLALAMADAGDYERARAKTQALLAGREKAELHHLLGDLQEHLGDPLDAVHEYQRAAEMDPREGYLFDWGTELLLHHAAEPALEIFSKGNRLFAHSMRMLIGVGAARFALGSVDQAVQSICEASDLDPGNSIPYVLLGKIDDTGDVNADTLVERFRRFVTLQPENADANYYYAVSLWKRRKSSPDAAVTAQVETLLNNAIRLDPKFAAAYLQLGILDSEKRNYSTAVSNFKKAVQCAPQLEDGHYRLARAYREIGETKQAKAELQIYDQMTKQSAVQAERERHEIRQFVYTLRDQPPAQTP